MEITKDFTYITLGTTPPHHHTITPSHHLDYDPNAAAADAGAGAGAGAGANGSEALAQSAALPQWAVNTTPSAVAPPSYSYSNSPRAVGVGSANNGKVSGG